MATQRYNSGIQRAKGILEIAAALYDTSLSHQTERAAEGVLQTDTRVGRVLRLSLGIRSAQRTGDVPISFATGSFREILAVAEGKYSLAWVNPSVLLTMAYRGKGPFKKRLPLRTIANFPSFDVMGFAVHESTGITSLADIKRQRMPLRVSTGYLPKSDFSGSSTMFTVSAVLRAAGFSLANIRAWGGKIYSVPRPSDPRRRAAIENGTINAIFDEGIKSWGQTAIDHGFRYLPIDGPVMKRMVALGYRSTGMSRCGFRGMEREVQTLDFSGWPMIVRADMPDEVAYALCEAIEKRREIIPTDNFKPLNIAQLCANDDEAPYDAPLHPGAQRFYRERGHLQ
ncbi:MAG TPA: TAXI family TRAP transporter solute-binding subunit [Candidatus Limnocylindria bacterium]|nr:TAXI family TRAP transporter solute-binding subunit [Candidatus Limnocylindria bacterium]